MPILPDCETLPRRAKRLRIHPSGRVDRPLDMQPDNFEAMNMSNGWSRRDLLTRGGPMAFLGGLGLSGLGQTLAAQDAQAAEKSVVLDQFRQAFADGAYALPKLPYAYDALEPHIDEATMRLHHDKHHLAYVNGLNATVANLKKYASEGEQDPIRLETLQRNLSFHGGGHVLHTVFWATMAPPENGENKPSGALAKAIDSSFGSFDGFKSLFSQAAGAVKGSGWAVLYYEPLGDMLVVNSLNEHDTKLISGSIPLLPLDVWEHAYYLKYQNDRGAYIKAYFNVINWKAVSELYNLHRDGHKRVATS